MKLKNLLKLSMAVMGISAAWQNASAFGVPSSLAGSDQGQGDLSVPVSRCQSGEFFCVQMGGGAFQGSFPIRLDSGARTLTVPKACLNPGSYKVIQEGVVDEWGNPATIVEGSVSLMKGDKAAVTVDHFQFFADDAGSCSSGFSNFGVSLNLDNQIPLSDGTQYCLGNFFSFYGLTQSSDSDYGYHFITKKNDDQSLEFRLAVGPLNSSKSSYSGFTKKVLPSCGGQSNVPSYAANTGQDWANPSATGFNIKISGIDVPSTDPSNPAVDSKIGMIDSGGGMVILSDDASRTIFNTVNLTLQGTLIAPTFCPVSDTWLKNCSCLKPGVEVQVSSQALKIDYSFISTDVSQDKTAGLAVCPPFQAGNSNPYILPNGANLGYQLFANNSVAFDSSQGKLGFTPVKDAQ